MSSLGGDGTHGIRSKVGVAWHIAALGDHISGKDLLRVWHVLATWGLSLEPESFMAYCPVFIFSKWSFPIWRQNHMVLRIVFVKLWKFWTSQALLDSKIIN